MLEKSDLPLTRPQIDTFHRDGYLVLKNVFSLREVESYREVVDKVINLDRKGAFQKNSSNYHSNTYYNLHNPLSYTDKLDGLIDSTKFFEVITFLMGPFIQMMGLHIFVRGCSTEKSPNNLMKFHTDSGPAIQRILPTPDNLPLQLKIQLFLTDVKNRNSGNFTVIPGSHIRRVKNYSPYCLVDECNEHLENGEMPEEAKQICVNAGDAVIHTLNLWHAVSPNYSNQVRKSISIRYGQLWFKSFYNYMTEDIINRLNPRQKRLLGIFEGETRDDIFYRPPEDQIPLMLGDKAKQFGWG